MTSKRIKANGTDTLQLGNGQLSIDQSNGRVGIGTSSPATLLDLNDTNPILRLSSTRDFLSGGWTDGIELGGMEFFTKDTSGIGPHVGGFIRAISRGSGTATTPKVALIFGTGEPDTIASEKFSISGDGEVAAGPANEFGFKMTVGNGIANNNVAVLSNCRANADLDGRNFTNATGAGILLRARGGDTVGTTVTFLVAGYASGVDTDATEAGGILGNGTWHLGVGNDNFSKGTWYATNLAGSPSLVIQNSGAVGTLRQMIRFRLGSTTNDAASGTNCGGVQTTDASVSPSFYIGASDERLKEGIETAPAGALSRLSQIRLVDFWLKGGTDRPKTRGVIAQELQQVYPDHVYTNEDGYFGVSMGWDWELIQAIQELAAKLDAAEARIKQLEDR